MATIVTDGTISGGGGSSGGGSTLLPGYFDSTGSVFCCHFDEESGGTWTSAVGNDLVATYGTAPLLKGAARPHAWIEAGGFAASAQASLQITGDFTAMLALKQQSTSTATQTIFAVADANELESGNICMDAYMGLGQFSTQHEYSTGSNEVYTWNSTPKPDARYLTDWHVLTVRRDETGALGTAKRRSIWMDYATSGEQAYTNACTGGTTSFLTVGALAGGSQLVQGLSIAGLVVFASALTNSQIAAQVDRILSGAAK